MQFYNSPSSAFMYSSVWTRMPFMNLLCSVRTQFCSCRSFILNSRFIIYSLCAFSYWLLNYWFDCPCYQAYCNLYSRDIWLFSRQLMESIASTYRADNCLIQSWSVAASDLQLYNQRAIDSSLVESSMFNFLTQSPSNRVYQCLKFPKFSYLIVFSRALNYDFNASYLDFSTAIILWKYDSDLLPSYLSLLISAFFSPMIFSYLPFELSLSRFNCSILVSFSCLITQTAFRQSALFFSIYLLSFSSDSFCCANYCFRAQCSISGGLAMLTGSSLEVAKSLTISSLICINYCFISASPECLLSVEGLFSLSYSPMRQGFVSQNPRKLSFRERVRGCGILSSFEEFLRICDFNIKNY